MERMLMPRIRSCEDNATIQKNTEMNKKTTIIFSAVSLSMLVAFAAQTVLHYYCKYCGHKTTSVNSLTASLCQRHPDGPAKGRHAPAL